NPKVAKRKEKMILVGEIPSPLNPPLGCRFHTRCPFAREECYREEPILEEVLLGHWVSCHFWDRLGG
ncbi:MAG: peptide ABC transporter substrate-binding protein, partial [Candidatus Korarchaeum sp.]|nr:peptide ABC transporter substrate-binding protein [Candidatus Korarchaeum sp.]